jgi:hypothetical protein
MSPRSSLEGEPHDEAARYVIIAAAVRVVVIYFLKAPQKNM